MIARLALYESGMPFNIHYMDIHFAKDQLKPWYLALNPAMTVPTLSDGERLLTDSRDILQLAATHAGDNWCDADPALSSNIQDVVAAQYDVVIEDLTFAKAMVKFPLLHSIFPRVLRRVISQLDKDLQTTNNVKAVQDKILLNIKRLNYFTDGNLEDKLVAQRECARRFLEKLPPVPTALLFGDKVSSADIVTAVFFGRLNMIGEYDLVSPYPLLMTWFERMQMRPAFKSADIWLRFKPWRILFRY
jgi:glutathione S-transferase